MSAPTREEFDQLAAQYQELASNYRRLEAEIKQIKEQPVHVTVDHQFTGYEPLKEIHAKIDQLASSVESIKGEIEGHTATLEQFMITQSEQFTTLSGIQADTTNIKATLSDQGESIRVLQADVTSIKATLSDQGESIRTLQETVATKEDIDRLRTEQQQAMTQLETRILDGIRTLLQPPSV